MSRINIKKIEDLMQEKKIDKHVLAKRANIPYNTLRGYWNLKEDNIPLKKLETIADVLEVNVSILLEKESNEKVDLQSLGLEKESIKLLQKYKSEKQQGIKTYQLDIINFVIKNEELLNIGQKFVRQMNK